LVKTQVWQQSHKACWFHMKVDSPAHHNRLSQRCCCCCCCPQGIGRATALLFAKKGYNVVVAARNKERLDQVVADCAEVAGRPSAALAVRTDVTDEAAVQDLVNRTLAKFDSVDVVVNNAGAVDIL
jgi:hypothetical protein